MSDEADTLDRAAAILRAAAQSALAAEVEKIASLIRAAQAPEPPRRVPTLRDGRYVLEEPGPESRGNLDNLDARLRASISAPAPEAERVRLPPSPNASIDRLPLAVRASMVATRPGRPW
jgi:hypothetical protein